MAHLWFETEGSGSAAWAVLPLESDYSLMHDAHGDAIVPVRSATQDGLAHDPAVDADDELAPGSARIMRATLVGGRENWLVIGRPGTFFVNGVAVETGVCVLRDRDELRLGSSLAAFFSTERRARIEPYPRDDQPCCPRCRLPIKQHDAAVRCPNDGCRVWHHQIERDENGKSRTCWTYYEACAACRHSTDLEGGFTWTPAGV